MPKSKTRYARAQARARYRKPKRRNASMGWNVAIALIVVVGGLLIFFTVRSNKSEAGVPPLPANAATGELGDHWHAAIDVDICGDKLPDLPEFETVADNPNVRTGLHTHGDGVIHIHPFYSSEAGNNATLGKYFSGAGASVTETSVDAWTGPTSDPSKTEWTNGDTCTIDGKEVKGVLRWSVNGKERTGNPADYKLENQDQILIFFGPKDAKLPAVESRTPEQDSADPSEPIGEPSTPATTPSAPSTPPPSS
jgi:hypothetical protein